jgi:serine protease Do
VIVDGARGLVLTNNHVVEGADKLEVRLADGRIFQANIRGTDPETDLAVIELVGDVPQDLPMLELGDSERLRLGEVVLAIGNPFGLQGSVTMGIVSALGRADVGLTSYENFIQTDAAINPGNSGGALVDMQGRLIGINTAIFSRSGGYQGIGFAIPSNMAQEITSRLITDGRVVRGFLGVGIQPLTPEIAGVLGLAENTGGVLINAVSPDSAAARAGLVPGDIITAIDGEGMQDVEQLRRTVALKGANQSVRVGIQRNGRTTQLEAVLDTLPGGAAATGSPPSEASVLGLTTRAIDGALRQQYNLSTDARGLVVTSVEPASRAERAGLAPGQVIIQANQRNVTLPSDLAQIVRQGGKVLLWIQRGGTRGFVVLES